MQDFFCLWQLCPSESWAWRWYSCLACGDPGGAKCAGTRTASAAGVMALSGSFIEPLVAGGQKASSASLLLPGVFLCCSERQAHRGAPLAGALLCRSACHVFDGRLSLVQLLMLACVVRKAMVMALPAMWDSAVSPCFHGCPAFLRRQFPPQSPHIPSIPLSAVNSSPRPGIAPQFLNSSSQQLHFPGNLCPCLCMSMYVYGKDRLILIPFRLPQISCFILSLKCFSSDSDSCPDIEDWTPASVPPPAEGSPVLLTLFLPLVPSTEFCVIVYTLFHWSGTPVCSQLMFCMHFWVWGCIPDVSVERHVFHVHLTPLPSRSLNPHPFKPPFCLSIFKTLNFIESLLSCQDAMTK